MTIADKKEEIADYHRHIKDFFRRWAPYYALVVDTAAGPLRKKVVRFSGVNKGKVLDLCTGTGSQASAFSRFGCKVCGVDFSEEMLAVARKRKQVDLAFYLADATKLPFEDNDFDACSVSFGLHEMPLFIRNEVVREMLRVLKPGGVIVTVDYSKRRASVLGKMQYHFIRHYESKYFGEFVQEELCDYLSGFGLVCEGRLSAFLGAVEVLRFRSR